MVEHVRPFDAIEDDHRTRALHWLDTTDDVFRRAKPRTPPQHLVSYCLVVDHSRGDVLLVDHVTAGLWLPPGGHVEPGEHPVQTVRRETQEELGVAAEFSPWTGEHPMFLSVAETTGDIRNRHTDVSLWFVLSGHRDQKLAPDRSEFRDVRWWGRAELADADPARFDPHQGRMLAKLDMTRAQC